MKLKLTTSQVLTDQFARAFGVLCSDTTIPAKERYAVGRTMQDIRQQVELYESERMKLIKLHGMGHDEYVALLEKRAQGADDARKAELKARAERALDFIVDHEDAEKYRAFSAGLQDLKACEFEVFLDHKVRVTDQVRLSAADLMTLDALVEAA